MLCFVPMKQKYAVFLDFVCVITVPDVCVCDGCAGVPAAYAAGGHRSVLAPAGVHAHRPPHAPRGLRALFFRRAARPQRQAAQRAREALALQFHYPRSGHLNNFLSIATQ